MLEIKNLTKKFGDFKAVDDINLQVQQGELFSIIGPNGSGKTTIIKSIIGLLQPTKGEILVEGENVLQNPQETKNSIGYISDNPKIWSHITGEEFLYFSGALYGMSKEEIKDQLPELLSHFNLNGIERKYYEDYSRGNKQKFSILAALLHDPQLLLVDEPIVGLDPEAADIAMDLLSDFKREGGSIFMATHTLPVAEKLSDRIGILHKGDLIDTGDIKYLRNKVGDSDASLLEIYHKFSQNKDGF